MRKTLIAAAVAASFVLGAAQPAWAVGEGYFVESITTSSGHTINERADGHILKSDATKMTIELDCRIYTSPPAINTGIDACYMVGADNTRYDAGSHGAMIGPVDVTNGVFHDIKRQHYRVCVQTDAFWGTDSFYYAAPLVCST